jgi:hypothetical protein
LGEFLIENQGKRCVVVLDVRGSIYREIHADKYFSLQEIEKVDDPKSLNPLLLPWDIGRPVRSIVYPF